jgi:hypothetical protein
LAIPSACVWQIRNCSEATDFEQALHVANHSTKRKLALAFGRGPIANEERLKSSAADVSYIF